MNNRRRPEPLHSPAYEGTHGHALQRLLELQAAFEVMVRGPYVTNVAFWRRRLVRYRRDDLHAAVATVIRRIPARRYV